MGLNSEKYCYANWNAPSNVKALVTTTVGESQLSRLSGIAFGERSNLSESSYKYGHFNLAMHVGDCPDAVKNNRAILNRDLKFQQSPFWLQQVHGTHCVNLNISNLSVSNPKTRNESTLRADASCTHLAGYVCAVMTADCLPILFCNRAGNWVAACHAGWRGLLAGVVENTLKHYLGDYHELMAWIGPAISTAYFEVGSEVKEAFILKNSAFQRYFHINAHKRFQFDFIALAKDLLESYGVTVYGGELCSFDKHFYSYRRDGETGRMASLVWFE